MDFKLSEEQQMLQDTAARLVRDEYAFDRREGFGNSELGYSAGFWRQLGELGLTSVSLPEAYGGFGGGVDSLLVLTELGRGLCLEPYLQSVVHAGGLLALVLPQQLRAQRVDRGLVALDPDLVFHGLDELLGIFLGGRRADVGALFADSGGTTTVARHYWSNQATNLVNDVPGEADLTPNLWGTWTLE